MVSVGTSSSSSSSAPEDLTPPEFRRLRPLVSETFEEFLRSGGGPEFSGPFTADITSAERDALGEIVRGVPGFEEASRFVSERLSPDALRPESNPFLQASIRAAQRPVLEAFDEGTLARRSQFTNAGQAVQESSPFARAQAIAERGLASELGDISTRLVADERARQSRAVDQASALATARFDRAVRNLEAQALPRLIEQLGIDRGQEEFNRRIDVLMKILGMATGATEPSIGQRSESSSESVNVGVLA